MRTQDGPCLAERTGTEVGGRGSGVFGEKSFTSNVEDKVSNEKSLKTVTMTLQNTHLECFGDRD